MEKEGCLVWWLVLALQFFILQLAACTQHGRLPLNDIENEFQPIGGEPAPGVDLQILDHQVVMSNGLVSVTFSRPRGEITGIEFNGIDNLLETSNGKADRGYWDVSWSKRGDHTSQMRLTGTCFKVILQSEDQVEISFIRKWKNGMSFPINVEIRYIMLRGSSGFYSYAIFERPRGWPSLKMAQVRIVFKLLQDKFRYMAISDERQRVMPTSSDRKNGRELDYPEAVQLTNPSNASLLGEVDDKYQYSCDNKDNRVHGWISNCPAVGFWMITPSDEFRVGGPFKQDLTSHCGPTVLSMFVSTHYAGTGMVMHFKEGEPWKKVFGPVFIYLNSDSVEENRQGLWQDAKEQMRKETASWPYTFPLSPDFSHSNQRGCIRGQLFFYDRYNSIHPIPAMFAYVGLALPGEIGSWQKENKGYQFWTRADSEGNFFIENIRVGRYNLFAWVPGVIGDYKYFELITITPGCAIELYDLVYNPPRKGATLWEIGVPDRTAAEFFIPEPEPGLGNHLYADFDKFRQYGLWKRYTELYPWKDLIYTIGDSNYKRDWFFAHVTRYTGNYSYKATTWQIKFQLNNVCKTRNYTLRLALASANRAELQVRVNNEAAKRPLFTTGSIGKDNAIARHGIHGFYYMYEVGIPGKELVNGNNTIFLKQSKASGLFNGVMYDYIRLEEPQFEEVKDAN